MIPFEERTFCIQLAWNLLLDKDDLELLILPFHLSNAGIIAMNSCAWNV